MPKVLNKIRALRKLNKKINIGVDGGVNLQNAKQIIKAGANVLYAGYSLNNINNIKAFKKIIKEIKS
jgi:ribulose-phosphate 3-epimerase